MSGLAAVWRRSGGQLDLARFRGVTDALDHRAVDGSDRWVSATASVILWHGHFRTTPEEADERQPLDADSSALVFDGRIDNRQELSEALRCTRAEAAALSDAAMVLRAYRHWGDGFVGRLKGPFAAVLWDASRRRLLGVRDALGRRTLFYRLEGDLVTLASEPGALVGVEAAEAGLDDVFLAHFFALRPAPQGLTLFTSVRELPAGYTLTITEGALRLEPPAPLELPPIHYRRLEDYGAHFAELLQRAVMRRMRASGPPAVMMSGGLDSTSVAALAASALAHESSQRRLSVLSYVFDELTELDERRWMAPMVARYDLDQTLVTADDAWPLSDFESWRWRLSGPDTGPFRPLNERLYAAGQAKGHRVLLTGAASDNLFVSGRASWLVDLVDEGHLREAIVELFKHVRRQGAPAVLRSASVRRLAARLTGRAGRSERPPPWLSRLAADCLESNPADAPPLITRRLPRDARAVWTSLNQSNGIATGDGEHRAGVEVRDPFTDGELVSFILSIPAYALYNRGASKLVLRMAMAHALPEPLLTRPTRSDIAALFWRGFGPEGSPAATALLEPVGALWGRYVNSDTFLRDKAQPIDRRIPALVRWQCLSYEWWMIQRASRPVKAV